MSDEQHVDVVIEDDGYPGGDPLYDEHPDDADEGQEDIGMLDIDGDHVPDDLDIGDLDALVDAIEDHGGEN